MATTRNSRCATLVTLFFLLMLVALPVGAQSDWDLPVDEFTTVQDTLTVTSTTPIAFSSVTTQGADILGQERDFYLEFTGGGRNIQLDVDEGYLAHSQGSGAYGYSLISWDGIDNDGETVDKDGLEGVDLTNAGSQDRFYILVISCDLGTTLTVSVYKAADTSHWWQDSVSVPADTDDTMFEMPFSGFAAQNGTIDWEDVGAITLHIDGTLTDNMDISIDFFGPGGPTAVDVATFTAAPANGNILVSWDTGSETDLLGFNLHRSETADGTYTQINTSVIPAENHGQPIGAAYSWLDEDVVRGETYYYKLEALEDGGLTTFFGPVSARAVHTVYLPLLVRQ